MAYIPEKKLTNPHNFFHIPVKSFPDNHANRGELFTLRGKNKVVSLASSAVVNSCSAFYSPREQEDKQANCKKKKPCLQGRIKSSRVCFQKGKCFKTYWNALWFKLLWWKYAWVLKWNSSLQKDDTKIKRLAALGARFKKSQHLPRRWLTLSERTYLSGTYANWITDKLHMTSV